MADELARRSLTPLEGALSRELAIETVLAELLAALGLNETWLGRSESWTNEQRRSLEGALLFVSHRVAAAASSPAIANALVLARTTLDAVRRERATALREQSLEHHDALAIAHSTRRVEHQVLARPELLRLRTATEYAHKLLDDASAACDAGDVATAARVFLDYAGALEHVAGIAREVAATREVPA